LPQRLVFRGEFGTSNFYPEGQIKSRGFTRLSYLGENSPFDLGRGIILAAKGVLAMEFSEKYELMESLTTGAVESFAAKNKARGESVLVHILQCEPQKPNQPTVQWVLEAFRKVAPEPAGVVLETGRYSGTTYAYVVTTLPDDAALRAWVQRYNEQNPETREVETHAAERRESKNSASQIPNPEPAVKPSSQVPVQFTQIFRELDSQAKRGAPTPPVAEANEANGQPSLPPDLPARRMPNFEERFPSAVHAAPKWDELSRTPAAAKEEPGLGSSAQKVVPDFLTKNVPAESGASVNNVAKPGEFTNFWQGPFHVDGPPEVPVSSSSPIDAQKKPGEFTQMFPRGAVTPETPVFTPTAPEQNPSRSGMTGWATHAEIMAQMAKEAAPVAPPAANEPAPMVAPPAKESPAARMPAAVLPQPVIPPPIAVSPAFPVPVPVPPKPLAIPVAPPIASSDATSAFRSAASEPVVAPVQVPEGPGAYTRIISAKQTTAEDVEPAEEQAGPKLPPFAAPSKPAMPAAPPLPKLPPAPKTAPPPVKAPKAPKLKAPKLDAPKIDAAKPPVSYWPMVLTLTVLFFVAVLLVLYFVLKH
jgi:hypothetical protein